MLRCCCDGCLPEGAAEQDWKLPAWPDTTLETTPANIEETDQLTEKRNDRKEESRVELTHRLGCQLDQRYGQRYSLQDERPFY